MKLCDRCSVPGCCLDYLGTACKNARKEYCPDIQLTRAEYLSQCDISQMADFIFEVFVHGYNSVDMYGDSFKTVRENIEGYLCEVEDEDFDIH